MLNIKITKKLKASGENVYFFYICVVEFERLAMNHNYCLIWGGGGGSRLWPVSRGTRPKQFLDLFGSGRTLLQQTYDRVSRIFPADNIYVSTNVRYLPLVYEQLPKVDDAHILEEPLRRGTLAAVAWGSVVIGKRDPEACLLISPADQMIRDEGTYGENVLRALEFVSDRDDVLVLGIRPTRPDTGYGYIQTGDEMSENGIFRIKTFTEKPAREFAEMFFAEGTFLWNTGLHVFRPVCFVDSLYRMIPEYQFAIPRMMADAESDDPKLVPEFFKMLPNLSLDMGVLERLESFVMECGFDWADIGTWDSIGEESVHDADGNVMVETAARVMDCSGNVIRLPRGRRLIMKGIHDFVVLEEGDVLMICPKEDAIRIARESRLQSAGTPRG